MEIKAIVETNVDDVIDAIIDQYGDEAEELLSTSLGRFGTLTVKGVTEVGEVICELSDDVIEKEYRVRFDNEELPDGKDILDAIRLLKNGDSFGARALLLRAYDSDYQFCRMIEDILR